jgi:hypothetical protein
LPGKGLRGLNMHPRKKWLAKFGEGGEYVPGRNPWENIDVALATRPPTYSQFGRITPEPYAAMGAVAPARDAVAPARDAVAPARDAVAPSDSAADDDDWAEFGGRRRKSRKSRKPRKSSNKKRKQRKTKRRRH